MHITLLRTFICDRSELAHVRISNAIRIAPPTWPPSSPGVRVRGRRRRPRSLWRPRPRRSSSRPAPPPHPPAQPIQRKGLKLTGGEGSISVMQPPESPNVLVALRAPRDFDHALGLAGTNPALGGLPREKPPGQRSRAARRSLEAHLWGEEGVDAARECAGTGVGPRVHVVGSTPSGHPLPAHHFPHTIPARAINGVARC